MARTTPVPIRPNEIRAIGAAFTGKTVLHPDFVRMDGLILKQAEELSRCFAAPHITLRLLFLKDPLECL
jgi:hypothetical protein